jgi:hypothetical protein
LTEQVNFLQFFPLNGYKYRIPKYCMQSYQIQEGRVIPDNGSESV